MDATQSVSFQSPAYGYLGKTFRVTLGTQVGDLNVDGKVNAEDALLLQDPQLLAEVKAMTEADPRWKVLFEMALSWGVQFK